MLLTFVVSLSATAGKGIQKPVRKTVKAAKAPASPSWSESFEDCDESDMFWLPEGWTAKRTEAFANPAEPHTWAVIKQMSMFYPEPVDGTHYATCYYNDDAYQDEWLYTPELTPAQGEYFTYYVSLKPFFLYDISKYDEKNGTMSEYIPTADLRLHISVDGGEWQQLNSMYDLYLNEDINELYEVAHNGYVSNRKMFVDMAPYVGHSVRFGFQYVGQGGNSMYLDDLRLTPLSMTVGYDVPQGTMYLGMTPDFRQPSDYLFVPDNTELVWHNTSSLEAIAFDWTYVDGADYTKVNHSSASDLTTVYTGYVSADKQVTHTENIIDVPSLAVDGQAGLHDTYTHPAGKMLVGGKAEVFSNGERLQTGASYCNPKFGHDILTTRDGVPYFGVGEGNKALWTKLFGTEAEVTGMGVYVTEPAKPWTMRGLHIQGIGSIERPYKLTVAVRKFNVYGSVDEEPVATAVIDVDNIVEQDDPSGKKLYTLPFLFADPITIDKDVIITLEGLPKAATWFAPLQTKQYESDIENSRAIFVYNYNDNYGMQTGMNYVSNLGVVDENGETMPCATNFFFNFDIAYGDCDDWGHVDVTVPGPEMPELTYADNTIVFVDAETLVSQFAEELPYKPLVCGFYDEATADRLTLYVCIGELYEYEGGPFYSDKVNDTYYIKLSMPAAFVDGKEHAIDNQEVTVDYYDLLSHSWVFHATEGKICVDKTGEHVYSVDVKALDAPACLAIGARYCRPDEWRFHDFNEVRPDSSEFAFTSGGRVMSHYDILSCVVDQSNPDIPVFYLADEEDLTTVAEVMELPDDEYVTISCPVELMDGLMKGFSGWSNDDLTVTYMGIDYNHSGCQHDDTCYGGNVAVLLYDTENNMVNINSKIFTMINYNKYNMTLHYEGPFSVDNVASGISTVETNINDGAVYNLAGQRINLKSGSHGKQIVIKDGKKYLIR